MLSVSTSLKFCHLVNGEFKEMNLSCGRELGYSMVICLFSCICFVLYDVNMTFCYFFVEAFFLRGNLFIISLDLLLNCFLEIIS